MSKAINPMLLCDFYKTVHSDMINPKMTKSMSYYTPRMSRVKRWDKVVNFGLQMFCKTWLIDYFNDNFFHLPEEEKAKLKGLPTSLPEALDALEADNAYLTEGGVFPKELIQNFIKSKRAECSELSKIPHPAEFEKYYNL